MLSRHLRSRPLKPIHSSSLLSITRIKSSSLLRSASQIQLRSLHDEGKWGWQSIQEFSVPDFTSEELTNRAKNSSLLRLVESYRVIIVSFFVEYFYYELNG